MDVAETGPHKTMWRRRWIPAAALALLAAAAAAEAARLGLGEAGRPGPGFFPFWLAGALAVVAAVAARRACGQENSAPVPPVQDVPLESRRVAWSFLVLAAYCGLLVPLGFLPATFLFFAAETRLIERIPWRSAMLRAAIATLLAFVLFRLLNVQLPPGYWMR